jgi:hypothetical protein
VLLLIELEGMSPTFTQRGWIPPTVTFPETFGAERVKLQVTKILNTNPDPTRLIPIMHFEFDNSDLTFIKIHLFPDI